MYVDEAKTGMISIRVSPEFRGQLKRCAKDFGWSLTDVIVEGASLTMIDTYDRLIVELKDVYENLKEGERKNIQGRMIGKAVADREYFVARLCAPTAVQPLEFPGISVEMKSAITAKA